MLQSGSRCAWIYIAQQNEFKFNSSLGKPLPSPGGSEVVPIVPAEMALPSIYSYHSCRENVCMSKASCACYTSVVLLPNSYKITFCEILVNTFFKFRLFSTSGSIIPYC